MVTEPADENCVIKMSGEGNFSYRGVTRTERKTFDHLTRKIADLEGMGDLAGDLLGDSSDAIDAFNAEVEGLRAKIKYAKDFGLIIAVAKSSDCPEGKLAADTRKGSDLERLEDGIADLIFSEKEVLDLKAQLVTEEKGTAETIAKFKSLVEEARTLQELVEKIAGRRFPIQDGPSIPWRMILPHEEQHQKNHGQTLERMAERKGLSPDEALAILDDESWTKSKWGNFTTDWSTRNSHPKVIAAKKELERRRAAFEDETIALRKALEESEAGESEAIERGDYFKKEHDALLSALNVMEARLKALEKEIETVNINWDADRQELEDVIADSVPVRPDEKEVSAELLQIVHAIQNCDEKTGPDKLCQCTRHIRDRFEALRSRLEKAEGLLREFRQTLNVADIEPKVGISQINEFFGEETCRSCWKILTEETTAKKEDGSVRLDQFRDPWCKECAAGHDQRTADYLSGKEKL